MVVFFLAYWAPYPDRLPSNVPACLAQLISSDSLFIIQQMEMVELFLNIEEPNFYLIQNSQGQNVFYAYETSDLCIAGCCKDSRGFQLHIMDMFHNEIIYLSKPCGCNNCFCCYPVHIVILHLHNQLPSVSFFSVQFNPFFSPSYNVLFVLNILLF